MAKDGLVRAFFAALWLVSGTSFKYELDDVVEQAHTRYVRPNPLFSIPAFSLSLHSCAADTQPFGASEGTGGGCSCLTSLFGLGRNESQTDCIPRSAGKKGFFSASPRNGQNSRPTKCRCSSTAGRPRPRSRDENVLILSLFRRIQVKQQLPTCVQIFSAFRHLLDPHCRLARPQNCFF